MITPSTPIYILPGSTLKQATIDRLLTTFCTTSALQDMGVPPSPLTFHDVPAKTHQCTSLAQIADYHMKNKEETVSVEPVIILDDLSEGEDGTVLVVGFPMEKDEASLSDDEEKESAQKGTLIDEEAYPRVRVMPMWINPLVADLSIGHQDLSLYIETAQDGVFRGFPNMD
ncbi:hypothetical protein BDZ94DRAFT_1275508 [Collybia nuda]|uniref:Uncharacterized protein n=1 Tax=Collybia nuda TaxID=64659 RepID=A0A9P5XRX3_9AGAR|nr:hypothetical protein BDZ94DRAFT_1275508 [Collybia nuda]